MTAGYSSKRVVVVYLVSTGLFTLAASLIWAVNTLFLLGPGGLTLFQVFLTNTVYVVGQAIFEIPTGVVADTIGRKASFLIGIAILALSTVLYLLSAALDWGFLGFSVAGVLIGLGYCFQTGAVDAWLVDALDATGWDLPKERVFAWGSQILGVATLAGTLLGGVLGQFNLLWPYVVRAGALGLALAFVAVFMRELGFTPRPLKVSNFGHETRTIFNAGVEFGWRNGVVRPMLWVSAVGGLFFLWGFYAWQRYMLDLLGQELVWMSGVVMAAWSIANILGAFAVPIVMRSGERRRKPARVLTVTAIINALLIAGMGVIGMVGLQAGWVPFGIATTLWLGFGFTFGFVGPISQGFINEHIPSAQRATVLSVQAFFADVGGGAGNPALGWVAEKSSLAAAFLLGSGAVALTAPLYSSAGRAADAEHVDVPEPRG